MESESENEIENINLQKVIILIVSSLTSSDFCDCHLNMIVLKNPPVLICCNSSTIISTAAAATSASGILYMQLVCRGRSMTLTDWERGCAVYMERNVWCWYYRHMACLDWPVQIYILQLQTQNKLSRLFQIHLAGHSSFAGASMHHIIFHYFVAISVFVNNVC